MPITSIAPNAQINARQLMSAKNAVKHNSAPLFKGGATAETDQFSKADREVLAHVKALKKDGVLERLSQFIALVTADKTETTDAKKATTTEAASKTFADIEESILPVHKDNLTRIQASIDKADDDAKPDFEKTKGIYQGHLVEHHEKYPGTLPKYLLAEWRDWFNGNAEWMKKRNITLSEHQTRYLHEKEEARKAVEKRKALEQEEKARAEAEAAKNKTVVTP